jgi:hypothetical protein
MDYHEMYEEMKDQIKRMKHRTLYDHLRAAQNRELDPHGDHEAMNDAFESMKRNTK